jgi:signal transduction histidine kinase
VQAAAGPKMLDLAAVIQKRQPLFRHMAGCTVQVETKTVAHAETMALGEAELDRILLNLVRNGIDAMPGGGRLTIELEYREASRRSPLLLRVSDTGNGIPADHLTHIFESGFSTKATGRDFKSGRGYGLAIVRELTLAAGGSVRVRSRMGRGTCFTLELPVLTAPVTSSPQASRSRHAAAVSEMPKAEPGRTESRDNFGANRKGTRVPC